MADPDLAPQLAAALEDGTLRLSYLPEVDLRSGEVVCMEALLRWHHPELGLLEPRQFFPAAQRAGLVSRLGVWSLRAAVAEARTWAEQTEHPPRLWLNVSAAQLTMPGFFTSMERLVRGRAMAEDALGIDVAEQTLALGRPGLARLLGRLRGMGLALAVDDFGSWYGSLAAFGSLPLDAVKLDGAFLRSTFRDVEGQAVLGSVVEVAHRRGMAVVAEGVETLAELDQVVRFGCDRAHGAVLCPPLPVAEAREVVAERRLRYGQGQPDPARTAGWDTFAGAGR